MGRLHQRLRWRDADGVRHRAAARLHTHPRCGVRGVRLHGRLAFWSPPRGTAITCPHAATLRAQRERLLGEVRAVHDETRVYPGLSFSPAGMAPLLRGASYDPARGALDVLDAVPGIAEAGWRPSAIMAQQAHERAVLQVRRGRTIAGASGALLSRECCGHAQGQLVDVTARIVAFADSWPFREPVNTRIVPRYAEVVKEPIGED